MADTDRPSKCELGFIRAAAKRAAEIFTFRTTTPGLTVTKSGTDVLIDYEPGDDGGGGPGGDITIPDVIGLEDALDGKAASSHGHAISDVTSLQATLDGKAASSHGHAISDVTSLQATLDGKAASSHGHAISDVTSLQATLDGKAASSHGHGVSDVTSLQATLDGKAASSHGHAISDVTSLQTALDGKAASSHGHAISDVTSLQTALDGKAASSHDHAASAITSGTFDAARIPIAGTTTIGGVKRNAGVAGQYITGYDSSGNAMYDEPTAGYRPGRSYLINGSFEINQRGLTSPINDGVYVVDRWIFLGDGNVGDAGQGGFSAGDKAFLVLGTHGANFEKKHGAAQIIESDNSLSLQGQTVTLSFAAKINNSNWVASERFKAAIIQWTGTANAMPRDFISAWNATNTNPTLVTNAAYVNTPVDLSLTTTLATYSVSGTISSSGVKNVAVLLWSDSRENKSIYSDLKFIEDVQLEIGSTATRFEQVQIGAELARCQRYYEVLRYNSLGQAAVSNVYSGTFSTHDWYYKATKRVTPTVTLASGSWAGGTPTITPNADMCYFSRAAGVFNASGTSGNVALAADAEL
jgi:hypothetical protein